MRDQRTEQAKGVLNEAYIIFISDHAHIETLKDEQHTVGTDMSIRPTPPLPKPAFAFVGLY